MVLVAIAMVDFLVSRTQGGKMKYDVCYAFSIDELLRLVKIYIGKGFKPQGGVCHVESRGLMSFSQAVVKEE